MSSVIDSFKAKMLETLHNESQTVVKDSMELLNSVVLNEGDVEKAQDILKEVAEFKKSTDSIKGAIENVKVTEEGLNEPIQEVIDTRADVTVDNHELDESKESLSDEDRPNEDKEVVQEIEETSKQVDITGAFDITNIKQLCDSKLNLVDHKIECYGLVNTNGVVIKTRATSAELVLQKLTNIYSVRISAEHLRQIKDRFGQRYAVNKRAKEYIGSSSLFFRCDNDYEMIEAATILVDICTNGRERLVVYFSR